MGYSQEHIDDTRNRILAAAGRLLRRHGYAGVSVAKIMSAAGLTHGGFYAHFKSKEELFSAMVGEEFDFTNQLRKLSDVPNVADNARAAVASNYYLDPKNSDRVAPACTLASSTQDVARAKAKTKKAFTRSFKSLLDEYEAAIGTTEGKPEMRQRALAAIATCVGGLVLSRALAEKDLASELLNACKDSVNATLVD